MTEYKRSATKTIRQSSSIEWAKFDTYHAIKRLLDGVKRFCLYQVAFSLIVTAIMYWIYGDLMGGYVMIAASCFIAAVAYNASAKLNRLIEEQRREMIFIEKIKRFQP